MKKIIAWAFVLAAFLPLSSYADETATSSDPGTPPPAETIHVTVNVRYKGSLVWNGTVALVRSSVTGLADNTGTVRTIPSDSALEALATADTLSSDFSVSDLPYYADFSSFLVNCIDIAALGQHACANWQYVVNSAYPPIGADKYYLSENDVLYFYFGSPRRVSLSSTSIEASSTLSVLTETYNYTNDTWSPITGILIGATQPNPNDPYSPLVLFSATSGGDGLAQLTIPTVGTYSVGIASDFYYPSETLTVTPKQTVTVQTTSSSDISRVSSASKRDSGSSDAVTIVPVATTTTPAVLVAPKEETTIILGISVDEFIRNYKAALANPQPVKTKTLVQTAPKITPAPIVKATTETQTASVIEAVNAAPVPVKNWFDKLLDIFPLRKK